MSYSRQRRDATGLPLVRGPFAAVLHVALIAAIGLVALLAVATTRADVDLWGHVRFGMDIVETGRIAATDPYSFTSDRPWVNHEWLSEVLFAEAWRRGGNAGLIAVKLACTLGALALLWVVLRNAATAPRNRVLLLGLALVGVLPRVNHVRPQLFSVLLFSALLLIFERAERRGRATFLWTVPVLGLWANVHGGWIVGLASVGLWTLGHAWSRRADGWRAWLVPGYGALAAAATLANPYGIGLWAFLFQTVGFGREAISEWGPLWANPPLLLLWGMFAAIGATAVVQGYRPRNPAALILPVLWGLASLRVSRLDSFFALSVIGLLGPGLRGLATRSRRGPQVALPRRLAITTAAATIALFLLIPAARKPLTCVDVYAPWWPEPEAVGYMQSRKLAGHVVTFFRWGEYGIWHLPRTLKISMDGRRETVYSGDIVSGHIQLYAGTDEGLVFLDSLPADYVWFPRALPVVEVLKRRGWVCIFEGPQSVLLARADRAERLVATAERVDTVPGDRCFPGP